MKKPLFLLVLVLCSMDAWAVEELSAESVNKGLGKIPQASGFSGYVSLGGAVVGMKSNMVAGVFGHEFSDTKVSSFLGEPDMETSFMPLVGGEVRYTLADSRTQFFAGNLLEDFLRFDMATQLGVRQEIGQAGIFSAALLRTSIPAEVWRDPYVLGIGRGTTEQDANGYRVAWNAVLGTGLELSYTQRTVTIDEEWSGLTQLGVPPFAYQALQREGTIRSLEAVYVMHLGSSMLLAPSLRIDDRNLDGKAMANDGYTLQLTHVWKGERLELVSNIGWGKDAHDGVNPLFLETNESGRLGLAVTAFYREPFGLKDWRASLGLAHYREDNDIAFYDTEASMLSASMLYTF